MSLFLQILFYILFQISLSQVTFTEVSATQQYYPRYNVQRGSNPCGLSICKVCIQIQCNNGVILDSNQENLPDNEYAWDYPDTTFEPPLTFVITKSNDDKVTFTDLISDYDTYRTFDTVIQFCPTPEPTTPVPTTNPTKNPTKTPTKTPTNTPTQTPTTSQPTKTPTFNPSKTPTKIPTKNPIKNPTKNSTKNPTFNPSKGPTKIPTKIPTKSPTNKPTISPTRNDNGGQISETQSTNPPNENDNNQSKTNSNSDGIFSDENETLITVLGIIIGSLICCIIILLICYFGRIKNNNDSNIKQGMELGRMMSNSINDVPGENDNGIHMKNGSESTEINTMLTAPDLPDNNIQNIQFIKQPIPAFDMYGDNIALKMWLNTCGVPQYYSVFVNEGFDEQLSTVITLNDTDLQRMGIVDIMHRRAIINQINIMKRGQLMQNNENNYEGNNLMTDVNDLPEEDIENGDTVGGHGTGNDSSSDSNDTIYQKNEKGQGNKNVQTAGLLTTTGQ